MLKQLDRSTGRPAAGSSRDLLVAATVILMVGGMYLDGWAHLTVLRGRLGGFVTPWHGVLYTGWALTGLSVATAGQRWGERWRADRVPRGYGLGLVGLGLSVLAAATDVVWHGLFGEEQGVGRLLSPPHLALFIGMALLASTPLRSAWLRAGGSPGVPAIASAAATLAIAMFVIQPVSPFVNWSPHQSASQLTDWESGSPPASWPAHPWSSSEGGVCCPCPPSSRGW